MNDRIPQDGLLLSSEQIENETELIPLITAEDEEQMNAESTPPELPILPLRNTVLFPGVVIPITVGRDRSIRNRRDRVVEVPHPAGIFMHELQAMRQALEVAQRRLRILPRAFEDLADAERTLCVDLVVPPRHLELERFAILHSIRDDLPMRLAREVHRSRTLLVDDRDIIGSLELQDRALRRD